MLIKKITHRTIYVFSSDSFLRQGMIKIGETSKSNPMDRVEEQWSAPEKAKLLWCHKTPFSDRDVHKVLENKGHRRCEGEWFIATIDDVKNAIRYLENPNLMDRPRCYALRPDQDNFVKMASEFFSRCDEKNITYEDRKFLLNAKMRFGKTFATLYLAIKMKWKRVLVLTYVPAVLSSWKDEVEEHQVAQGWIFADRKNPIKKDEISNVFGFLSFQDIRDIKNGNIKEHLKPFLNEKWDCIVADEYHFGAWRESAKELYDEDIYNSDIINKFKTLNRLYVSGTPFRALEQGEFSEEQIYHWNYIDEQKAKKEWNEANGPNPYAMMPEMVYVNVNAPDSVIQEQKKLLNDEFSLSAFFKAKNNTFKFQNNVSKWLEHFAEIRKNPDFDFDNAFQHMLWRLSNVASCKAMKNLLDKHPDWSDYNVIVAAGTSAGVGMKALEKVQKEIGDGLNNKTITLSCGKLGTGVTIKQLTSVVMLSDMSSLATYQQVSFRAASPWVINEAPDYTKDIIKKHKAYVFDFSPNRALVKFRELAAEIANQTGKTLEQEMDNMLNFSPILSLGLGEAVTLNTEEIMDQIMFGETQSMMAKRWQDASMFTLDSTNIEKIANDADLLAKIDKNTPNGKKSDNKVIISANDDIKKLKNHQSNAGGENKINKKIKEDLQTLLKRAFRGIPHFIYLSNMNEQSFQDVINTKEVELFKEVTHLNIDVFQDLLKYKAFNVALIDSTIRRFNKTEK